MKAASNNKPLIDLRPYQEPVLWSMAGVLVLHWSRQIGKSYVLAAWAVYRLLTNPGRLVTVLSNSRANGAEFIQKCTQVCGLLRVAFEREDLSADELVENMRVECRIKVAGKWGRIVVLAANPRTARGFSGDLILDEFAFHEDSEAIWDAAEPIVSSNPDFLCRVASTGNGRYNMFYRMAALGVSSRGELEGFPLSEANYPVSRMPRSEAYKLGVRIFDPATRREITPEEARAAALDKRSYDQNYECSFNDENMALLTLALISAAEYSVADGGLLQCRVCEEEWDRDALEFLASCQGPLGVGIDVGRNRDLTSVFVGERVGGTIFSRALLRMSDKRLPYQLREIEPILRLPNFGRGCIDSTGIGLGLGEFAQEKISSPHRIELVNFATREKRIVRNVEQKDSALVGELMALDMLALFEDCRIRIPCEQALRDALRKPERVQTANGVRIAVERDEAGHADEFWSLALLIRALTSQQGGIADVSGIRSGPNPGGASFREIFQPRQLVRRIGRALGR